jgi:hypothetical protein
MQEDAAQARLQELADKIVLALAERAERDTGLSVEQVQKLLALRVQNDARAAGVSPRDLMSAVWRSWQRHDQPPMLGERESWQIVDSLVAKGFLTREETGGDQPVIRWSGLSAEEVELRLAELNHDEQLFVRGVLRYLARPHANPQ